MSEIRIPLASVVLDYDLYPHFSVDKQHVSYMVEAMMADVEFPPIIIDKKSKRVVDGFKRVLGFVRHLGDEGSIKAIEKTYKNDAALFLDSMRFNADHGVKLDRHDRVHCIHLGRKLKISMDDIAQALHMKIDQLESLKVRRTAFTKDNGEMEIALKRTYQPWAGKRLTRRQAMTNERSGGMDPVFYVNQMIDMIESEMFDLENSVLVERTKLLGKLIRQKVK